MTRERFEQILFAHVSDEVVQDMLNQYVLELESNNTKLREKIKALTELASIGKLTASQCTELAEDNAKLRELVRDMLPFAEVGMDDTCVTRRCCLFEQCEYIVGVKCAIEQHMLDRMRELGVEVDT